MRLKLLVAPLVIFGFFYVYLVSYFSTEIPSSSASAVLPSRLPPKFTPVGPPPPTPTPTEAPTPPPPSPSPSIDSTPPTDTSTETPTPPPTEAPTPPPVYPTIPPNRFAKTRTIQHPVCSWKDEDAGKCKVDLKDDLVVGVLTYHGSHYTKIRKCKESWMKDYLIDKSIFIISDKEDAGEKIINSGCPEGARGLSCKTPFLYKTLYEKNPNAKWYLRAMDDTYVHLPNMLNYLAQYDENVPMILGLLQVYSPVNDWHRYFESQGPEYRAREHFYPQGGCGWVMSNAYMKKMLEPENWSAMPVWMERLSHIDDLGMGAYTEKHMNIALIHYFGFAQIAWQRRCPTGNAIPNQSTAPNVTDLVTLHARAMWQDMPELHKVFVHDNYSRYFYDQSVLHNDKSEWWFCDHDAK